MSTRTYFNISWETIGIMVRRAVAEGLSEIDLGIEDKEDCDRLNKIADGGDLDPSTIAKWVKYHDRPQSEKDNTTQALLHGGGWGDGWMRFILNKGLQGTPQVEMSEADLHGNVPIELIEEVRARIKGRKEMYGWGDLCSSDDCLQLMIDGDQWCALIGPNIQEGWAGFGSTRTEATLNLYKQMLNG